MFVESHDIIDIFFHENLNTDILINIVTQTRAHVIIVALYLARGCARDGS